MNNEKKNTYASEKLAREAATAVKNRIGCELISFVEEPSAVVITRDDPMEGIVIIRFEW